MNQTPWYLMPFALLGALVLDFAYLVGDYIIILWRSLKALLRLKVDGDELVRSLYRSGVESLPIIATTAAFVGGIMVLQASLYIRSIGAYNLVGWFAAIGIMREVGPVYIGLMFSGRVGANNTAQLASMMVTEQVTALRVLAIDPYGYLVIPRLFAMTIAHTCLVIFGDLAAILAGAVVAFFLLGVTPNLYYLSIVNFVNPPDFLIGVIKGAIFGLAIGLSSCHYGFATRGGAQAVGRAVNGQVVASAVLLFVLDYLFSLVWY